MFLGAFCINHRRKFGHGQVREPADLTHARSKSKWQNWEESDDPTLRKLEVLRRIELGGS